jgi:hypothetical protein
LFKRTKENAIDKLIEYLSRATDDELLNIINLAFTADTTAEGKARVHDAVVLEMRKRGLNDAADQYRARCGNEPTFESSDECGGIEGMVTELTRYLSELSDDELLSLQRIKLEYGPEDDDVLAVHERRAQEAVVAEMRRRGFDAEADVFESKRAKVN